MKKILVPFLFLLLVLGLAAFGPDAPADGPAQTGEPAQSAGEAETEPPETFVPSEKLPADSAISFPVDI